MGHLHHVPCIQYTIAKQVVELQSSAVILPEVLEVRIKQAVSFGGQDSQVLDVSPGQVAAIERTNVCKDNDNEV